MSKSELVVDQPKAIAGTGTQLSQADRLIELAIVNQADPAYLDKLLDLKERYDREESRKAFTAALSAFKAEHIEILKDQDVGFKTSTGYTEYSHASLGNIVEKSTGKLAENGLSHRWDIDQDKGIITVTCILSHAAGHSESVKLSAGADNSGNKNSIQQVASTITYLQRYTYLAITGLAVKDQGVGGDKFDNDGATAEAPVQYITEEDATALHAMITDNNLDLDLFMGWLVKVLPGVDALNKIPMDQYAKIRAQVERSIKNKKEASGD